MSGEKLLCDRQVWGARSCYQCQRFAMHTWHSLPLSFCPPLTLDVKISFPLRKVRSHRTISLVFYVGRKFAYSCSFSFDILLV